MDARRGDRGCCVDPPRTAGALCRSSERLRDLGGAHCLASHLHPGRGHSRPGRGSDTGGQPALAGPSGLGLRVGRYCCQPDLNPASNLHRLDRHRQIHYLHWRHERRRLDKRHQLDDSLHAVSGLRHSGSDDLLQHDQYHE